MNHPFFGRALAIAIVACATATGALAATTWPKGQLLPSFPAPRATQDLAYLYPQPITWEAEGPALQHATGHLDGDGWLCQTGVDTPNAHMVYGPYDADVPAGPNTARFRLKIDNNTANNDPQVILDVRDAATGAALAQRTVNRMDFTAASQYVTFALPFTLDVGGHALELRVYWLGAAYIKVDSVSVDQGPDTDQMTLFASLKGIVNYKQPRIFTYEGDAFAEGPTTWLQSLGLGWTEVTDNWSLLTKYRSAVAGVVVYDPAVPDTINLATMIARQNKAVVSSPYLLPRLTASPYKLPVLVDLRGKYASKLAVYQDMLSTYWPQATHRVVFGLSPTVQKAAAREYATALGAAVVWLDPRVPAESPLLDSFLSGITPGGVWLGWWPEEGSGVERASEHGVATVASDWSTNLSVHSGMPRKIHLSTPPAKPALQNKIYVAFVLSDGDNLQYVEHLLRKLWNDPGRGQVPMGWTMSPSMLDAMPGALNFFHTTATANDNLVSGPSGYGYTYPNSWTDAAALAKFITKSNDYNKRAGFKVLTVWNTITGGISTASGNAYAANAPDLLGMTAQNTGGGLTIYDATLPGLALSCNYCTGEGAMESAIASAAQGWDGRSPRFIIIQAQPWTNVTPTSFLDVSRTLDANYVVVRPDNFFQLLREANGLAWW